jgi:monofunctional chorismate mutase
MRKLNDIRLEIDQIDDAILKLFLNRMVLIQEIKAIKKNQELPTHDQNREEAILKRLINQTSDEKLRSQVTHLFNTIMKLSKEYQQCDDTD